MSVNSDHSAVPGRGEETGMFRLDTEMRPSGDQPEAIKQLTEGVLRGESQRGHPHVPEVENTRAPGRIAAGGPPSCFRM